MQELEAHVAKAQFARRHLSKMAGIGLAALIAAVAMPKPAQARHPEDNDHDRDDRGGGDPNCFLKGTKIRTLTGERNVEDLAIGDLLPTPSNGIRPIQWIGRCKYTRSMLRRRGQPTRCLFGSRARRWARTCRTRICTYHSNTRSS